VDTFSEQQSQAYLHFFHQLFFMSMSSDDQRAAVARGFWAGQGRLLKRKLSKILLELCIIIFGVSVSIWLNNWSRHHQEQVQMRIFLLGLKQDLQADTNDIRV
jgi:uncharacterized membrane protein YcjF (UPF0283 family)